MEQHLSQSQIKFFQKNLQEQRKKIITNLDNISIESNGLQGSHSGDESDLASLQQGLNTTRSLSEQQQKNLELIKRSLEKIEEKTYGICEDCDEPICIERLKVKNFAQYCITCKEINEKNDRFKL